jgi:hypothetical protein
MQNRINSLLLFTGILVSSLSAQGMVQTVFVVPNQVEAGKAFQVTLSGKTSLCNPQFSHHSATADNGSIILSVLAENDPLAKCTAGEHDYQTDFQLPALKAGSYEINFSLPPACRFSTPACYPPERLEYAGTLIATDTSKMGFSIPEKHIMAGKAFDMFVVGKNYTCANEFLTPSTTVTGHAIYVNFTNRVRIGMLCIATLQDYGPTFTVPALKVGTYQVFTSSNPYCAPGTMCPLGLTAPQLSGALSVVETVSVKPTVDKATLKRSNPQMGRLHIDIRHGVKSQWKGKSTLVSGSQK